MINRKHILWYITCSVLLVAGIIFYQNQNSLTLTFFSFVIAIITLASGEKERRKIENEQKRRETYKKALDELIEEKEDAEETLTELQESKSELWSEKRQKSKRLSNLKRILDKKGISPRYIVREYGESLKAPILVLTHFTAPNHNSESDEDFIRENLGKLGTQPLQGATKVIPPRSIDQEIQSESELEKWFHDTILDGREDINYKLELLSLIDVSEVFGQDASRDDSGEFGSNIINEIFDTDPVIETHDLAHVLADSNRFSLEEELKKNVALLAVPFATESQMKEIIGSQLSIQRELGEVKQIANTRVEEIESVLDHKGVEDADALAAGIREEANEINSILGSLE